MQNWNFTQLTALQIGLIGAVLAVYTYCAVTGNWELLGGVTTRYLFGDLAAVLGAAECSLRGIDVFLDNPCDPFDRVHSYPKTWLVLRYLSLGAADAAWLAPIIVVAFVVTTVWLVRPTNRFELGFLAAFLLSPAVVFGIETTNVDFIIYLLLVATAVLWAPNKRVFEMSAKGTFIKRLCSLILLALAALLKVYPGFWFLGHYFVADRRRGWTVFIWGCVIMCMAALILIPQLLIIKDEIAKPDGWRSFGAALLLNYSWFVIAATIGLLVALLVYILRASGSFSVPQVSFSEIDLRSRHLFAASSLMMMVLFLLTTHYDFRAIMYLLFLPYLFSVRRQSIPRTLRRAVNALLLNILVLIWAEALIRWSPSIVHYAYRLGDLVVALDMAAFKPMFKAHFVAGVAWVKLLASWAVMLISAAFAVLIGRDFYWPAQTEQGV